VIALPSTATTTTQTLTGSSLPTTPSTGSTDALTNTNVSYADIEKAYSDKRYLSVISLSNGYLTNNAPTYELLRIRYRTYFIIGKYTESLSEIAKIQSLGKLDKQTACDAQVIATYGKDSSLVTKYTALCK
jgi:hypothetical protein